MQAELFEQNAILMTTDNALANIYNDLLMVNGYLLTSYCSIPEVVKNINEATKLVILDLDNENIGTVVKAVKGLRSRFAYLRIIGMSIYPIDESRDEVHEEFLDLLDSFFVKPVHIDDFMKVAFRKCGGSEIVLL